MKAVTEAINETIMEIDRSELGPFMAADPGRVGGKVLMPINIAAFNAILSAKLKVMFQGAAE